MWATAAHLQTTCATAKQANQHLRSGINVESLAFGNSTPLLCLLQVLTWTLFALMQQPEVERKLLAELYAEVGDEAVSAPTPSLSLYCCQAGLCW